LLNQLFHLFTFTLFHFKNMSKNAKTILIILGIFAVLAGICVVGVGFLVYKFADTAKIEESERKGAEFGRTTDNIGCEKNAVSTVKNMGQVDIGGMLQTSFFFKSCLNASRKTANYCDNVPSDLKDKLNDDKWKDSECEKNGLKSPHLPCRMVMKSKSEFCNGGF